MAATQRGAPDSISRLAIGASMLIGLMSADMGRLEILHAGELVGLPCLLPAIWAVSGRALRQPGVTLAASPLCLDVACG